MKLTERDQDKLKAALDVALGVVSIENADTDELGWDWYRPDEHEVRAKCRDIILELIVKAGEPEPGKEDEDASL